MNITINSVNFKGYDARPLKGLFASDFFSARHNAENGGCTKDFYKTIDELAKVAPQEKLDIFIQNALGIFASKDFDKLSKATAIVTTLISIWTQDCIEITKNKFLISSINEGKLLGKFLNCSYNKATAQGGNFFIVNNGKKDVIIIGKNNAKQADNLKKNFESDEAYIISQPEFHIDMGIRPLNDKNILVNDFNEMCEILKKYLNKAQNFLRDNPQNKYVRKFAKNLGEIILKNEAVIKFKDYADADKISEELTNYGFNPIKVPAAIASSCEYNSPYDDEKHIIRQYSANFINAIVHERKDKSLVYFTNKPSDKICNDKDCKIGASILGFDLKKIFEDSVKNYIAPSDIHYFSTQNLLEQKNGGIHCIFSEIPEYR